MCAAILLRRRFAMEQEAATLAEATAGERVRPPVPGEMPTIACKACDSSASFNYHGATDAPDCINVVSGSCEQIWITLHPEGYTTDDGTLAVKSLFCGQCPANLTLTQQPNGQIEGSVCDSTCGVNAAGENYRATGAETLNKYLPSRETILRGKAAREQELEAERLAWEKAHPEEAARWAAEGATAKAETGATPQARLQLPQNEVPHENGPPDDDAWEEYDGDPSADLPIMSLQAPENESYPNEVVEALDGHRGEYAPMWFRRSPGASYPNHTDAREWWSDPRWKWLTSQDPIPGREDSEGLRAQRAALAEMGYDTARPGKQ